MRIPWIRFTSYTLWTISSREPSVVLSVVLLQLQLAAGPELRVSCVAGNAAVYWLFVVIQLEELLRTQPLEIRASGQYGQVMRDRHDPSVGELTGERGDPG